MQLLRTFGGDDALSDLAELLNDSEAHVQREAVRALIAIAVDEAYALLEQALASEDSKARASVIQELSTTRDERATPLFCYMLRHLECRGATREIYLKAVSRLGTLGGPAAVEALTEVLHKGLWWAPQRATRVAHRGGRRPGADCHAGGDGRPRGRGRARQLRRAPNREEVHVVDGDVVVGVGQASRQLRLTGQLPSRGSNVSTAYVPTFILSY